MLYRKNPVGSPSESSGQNAKRRGVGGTAVWTRWIATCFDDGKAALFPLSCKVIGLLVGPPLKLAPVLSLNELSKTSARTAPSPVDGISSEIRQTESASIQCTSKHPIACRSSCRSALDRRIGSNVSKLRRAGQLGVLADHQVFPAAFPASCPALSKLSS